MSYQSQDLIKKAMQKAGIIAKSETPSADELQDGLKDLNLMLNSWSVMKLMVFGSVQESFALVAGTRTYTIGATGVFATTKPIRVTGGFIRDSNNVDTGLSIVPEDSYDSFQDKAISKGRPELLNFDAGLTQQAAPLGTIALYPIPDQAYTLYLDSYKHLNEIATINTTITLDEAYNEAIIYNLIPRIWREYHDNREPIPEDLIALARGSFSLIKNLNSKRLQMGTDLPGQSGAYNINTGQYNS